MTRDIAVITLLVLCVGTGVLNVFLMPPFMNPDEIQHFMFSAQYAYAGDPARLKALETRVMQLLKDYRWFHFIGMGPGWEGFESLRDVFFLNNFTMEKYSISKSYFHFIYGKMLKLTGIRDPLRAFYFLRLLSFFMYLGTCFLCFSFYKKYFPGHWYYLSASQLLIYQLGTILNSVNYDVLLTFLGALFFILAYRFMVSEEKWDMTIVLAALIAALASLVKTGGVLFFVYFFLLLLFKYGVNRKMLKGLSLGFFLLVIVYGWFNYRFPGRFFKLYGVIFLKLRSIFSGAAVDAGNGGVMVHINFFNSIVDSFYFYTGWMGFKLPGAWHWALKFFLLTAVIGVIVAVGTKKKAVVSTGAVFAPGKRWLVYGILVMTVHVLAVRFYYGSGLMAQGRYFYPLLILVIMMIYKGLNSLDRFLKFKGNYLVVSYILFLAIFFVASLTRVIWVFYLAIASPHAGL